MKGYPRAKRPSAASQLTEWLSEGIENFFDTQRLLVEFVQRQNSRPVRRASEELSAIGSVPAAVAKGIAASSTAAQGFVIHRMGPTTGFSGGAAATTRLGAATVLERDVVEIFTDLQLRFLRLAARQMDAWVEDAKSDPYSGSARHTQLARKSVGRFVRCQKKFLQLVAEAAHATHARGRKERHHKTGEIAELAQQASGAFADAQQKLLELAAHVTVKPRLYTSEVMIPTKLIRQALGGRVVAQIAPLETRTSEHDPRSKPRKPADRVRSAAAAASA